jgi:peptidoglycan/xylan/chitin deacetylase (PgdA/CDA1 family)
MYVTPSTFERHLQFLKAHYEVLSFSDLLDRWREKSLKKNARYCVITFDDGWLDNYLHAFPLLKKHSMPATIFLPTSFIGTERWFWPERLLYVLGHADAALEASLRQRYAWLSSVPVGDSSVTLSEDTDKRDAVVEACKARSESEVEELVEFARAQSNLELPSGRACVNWNEVEEMSKDRIEFGSHTRNHRILTNVSLQEVQDELDASRKDLERTGVHHVPVFAYPNGNYDEDIKDLVRSCDYFAAVTTNFGFESFRGDGDPLQIRRISIHDDVTSTPSLFALHLSGLWHSRETRATAESEKRHA